jgi:hypothetical protein
LSAAARSRAGSLDVLGVDLAVVVIPKLLLLAQLALEDSEDLPEGQADFVVASAAVLMVDVVEADTEVAFRIDQATVVVEEVLAIKAEEASHPEVDMAAIEAGVAGVVEVEIAVGMAATRLQMHLLALEVDVVVVCPHQVGMDVAVTADQAPQIGTAQHQPDLPRHLEVGMIHVAHMMTDPAAVIVAAAAADMVTVVATLVRAAAATWSR